LLFSIIITYTQCTVLLVPSYSKNDSFDVSKIGKSGRSNISQHPCPMDNCCKDLKRLVENLQVSFTSLNHSISQMTEDQNEKISKAERSVQTQEEEVRKLKNDTQQMRQAINYLKKSVSNLRTDQKKLKEQNEKLTVAQQRLYRSLEDLKQKVDTLETIQKANKQYIQELFEQTQNLNSTASTLESSMAQLKSETEQFKITTNITIAFLQASLAKQMDNTKHLYDELKISMFEQSANLSAAMTNFVENNATMFLYFTAQMKALEDKISDVTHTQVAGIRVNPILFAVTMTVFVVLFVLVIMFSKAYLQKINTEYYFHELHGGLGDLEH
jgi:DNA repair exonuclease SbcCD ATPase subunit